MGATNWCWSSSSSNSLISMSTRSRLCMNSCALTWINLTQNHQCCPRTIKSNFCSQTLRTAPAKRVRRGASGWKATALVFCAITRRHPIMWKIFRALNVKRSPRLSETRIQSNNSFQSNDLCVRLNFLSNKGAASASHLVLAAKRKWEKIVIAFYFHWVPQCVHEKVRLLLRVEDQCFFSLCTFFFPPLQIRNPSLKVFNCIIQFILFG